MMWIWDGTDREEGDGEAAFADAVRRVLITGNEEIIANMRTFVAAFWLVLTNRRSSTLTAPEPIIQGGFTPSDDERELMCESVRRDGRDLIHICFRTVEPYTPTGLIVVVYRDGDHVRLHSRTSLIWVARDRCVRIYGVEDESDVNCHFVMRPGARMVRHDGFPTPAGSLEMRLAAEHVERLIARGAVGDAVNERLVLTIPQGLGRQPSQPVK
jgi:hypothetical protein